MGEVGMEGLFATLDHQSADTLIQRNGTSKIRSQRES